MTQQPEEKPRPLAELRAALKSDVWSDRSQAVLEIGAGRHKEAASELLHLMQTDPHPAVRQTSALVLADFQDRRASPVLAAMLRNKDATADYLLDAAERLADPSLGPAVVPYLDDDLDQTRLKAVSALEKVGSAAVYGEILFRAERNTNVDKAKTFAMACGHLKIAACDNFLLGLAAKTPPGPTLAATYRALGRIGSRRGVPVLVKAIGADFDKGRENSVEALLLIQDASACPLAFPLLETGTRDVRYAAAAVIGGIPSPGSGPRALALLEKKDPAGIGPAAYVLGHLKYQPARKSIETLFEAKDTASREELGQALGWLGGTESVPVLLRVLAESDGEGRYGAVWALGILHPPEALDPLLVAAKSSDKKLRRLAIEAVGFYASVRTLDTLKSLTKNDPTMRVYALESIAAVPGPEARAVLVEFAMKADSDNTQQAAILALGKRKEPESIEPLIRLLKDDQPMAVNNALFHSLRMITGKEFVTRDQWIQWAESGRK